MKCAMCGEYLPGQMCVWIMGKGWHRECLKCYRCHRKLLISNLRFDTNGLPWCGNPCYSMVQHTPEGIFAPGDNKGPPLQVARIARISGQQCAGCGRVVTDNEYVSTKNGVYHLQCFPCAFCQRAASRRTRFEDNPRGNYSGNYSGNDVVRNTNPYIPGMPCMGCRNDIFQSRDDCIRAHGGLWHRACFFCRFCGKFLTPESSGVLYKRLPYCSPCHPVNIQSIRLRQGEPKMNPYSFDVAHCFGQYPGVNRDPYGIASCLREVPMNDDFFGLGRYDMKSLNGIYNPIAIAGEPHRVSQVNQIVQEIESGTLGRGSLADRQHYLTSLRYY